MNAQVGDMNEYVDLGLPSGTLWATCNVGAEKPEDSGYFFCWGETIPYNKNGERELSWSTYKYCDGIENSLTKYCTQSSYGIVDNKTELDVVDDAAYINCGSEWRMPSHEQQVELYENCTWKWTTKNGVRGYLVTGPNNNQMFMPATGEPHNGFCWKDEYAFYGSRTLYTTSDRSFFLGFGMSDTNVNPMENKVRREAYPVRAVRIVQQQENDESDYVDLGLPSGLLWATHNIGATAPEEVGGYFAWGETTPKQHFVQDNYQYYVNGDYQSLGSDISGTQYDAATVNWGTGWRMPKSSELEELANYCTRTEVTKNGVPGLRFTGSNGNSIFIPKGGRDYEEGVGASETEGCGLWSSTAFSNSFAERAWEWDYVSFSYRHQGFPIRPVFEKIYIVAKPTISYKDGKLTFDCDTEDVTFVYSFISTSADNVEGNNVVLPSTFTVSVYAKKDGYLNSDVATQEIDVHGIKGDVDGDGVVDVNDVQTTINIILNK